MTRQYVNLAEIMGQVDNARANESNLKRQQQQMQMEDYAYQRQLKQDQEQEALRGVYSGAIDTTGGAPKLNEKKLIQDLMQRGYGEQALKMQADLQERDLKSRKLANEEAGSSIDLNTKKAKYGRDVLAGSSPQDYAQRRQHLIEQGFAFAKGLPEQYNSDVIGKSVMDADSYIKQNAVKAPEIAFTPSGISYNKNDPNSIKLGENYGKPESSNAPAAIKEYEYAKGQGFAGTLQDYEKSKKTADTAAKPLPTTALKLQNETLDKLSIANNNNVKLKEFQDKIEKGQLELGLFSNIAGSLRNRTGTSNESSRNLSSFKSSIEKLRNDSLRLNTGVQTDGDAQRAWNELFENITDKDLVLQRLKEIQEINARGADLQKLQVENIRSNYNADPVDFSKYEAKPTGKPTVKAQKNTPAATPKLKLGTVDGGYVYRGGDPANPNSWKKSK